MIQAITPSFIAKNVSDKSFNQLYHKLKIKKRIGVKQCFTIYINII